MFRLDGGASGLGQADLDEEERRKRFAKALMGAGEAAKDSFRAAQTAAPEEPEMLSAMKQRIAQKLQEKRRLAMRKPGI